MQIQKADLAERRRYLRLLGVAIVLGIALILLYRYLLAWAVHDPALGFDRLGVVAASLMLFALPTVLFARSMWTAGHAAAQAKRFPPPGKAVVRDTQVLTGAPAVRRARLMQWLSVAVGVLSLALPIALWAFISTLGKTT